MSALTLAQRVASEHRQSSRYNGGLRVKTCTCGAWEATPGGMPFDEHAAHVAEMAVTEALDGALA